MGREWQGHARQQGWRGQRALWGALCAALLALGVAACSGAQATGTTQASPTATGPAAGVTVVVGQTSATPTTLVVGGSNGAGGTVGAGDICSADRNVQSQPPASVPSYPSADLRLGYVIDNAGTYGFCAQAATGDIATYYSTQLPAKGWSNVKTQAMSIGSQTLATKGNSSIVVTMLPDSHHTGATNVLIIVTGL